MRTGYGTAVLADSLPYSPSVPLSPYTRLLPFASGVAMRFRLPPYGFATGMGSLLSFPVAAYDIYEALILLPNGKLI